MLKIQKLSINNGGMVTSRESATIEFKKTFHKQVECYVKTICSFANNKGGCLIFGVGDKPRKPFGLIADKLQQLDEYDSKDLETKLQNFLSVTINFELYSFEQNINDKKISFGVLYIKESEQKPVICLKSYDKTTPALREGAIYYRYAGQSKEIKAQDLMLLMQKEREKEQKKWLEHIQKIATIGVGNAGIFSYDGDGEIYAGERKIIFDKGMMDKIKFIREGHFVEKDGAPALILKGAIQDIKTMQIVKTDKSKDYLFEGQKDVINAIKQMGFSERMTTNAGKSYHLSYLFVLFKKEYNVENDDKYFWSIGKTSVIKRYSQKCIDDFAEFLKNKQTAEVKKVVS